MADNIDYCDDIAEVKKKAQQFISHQLDKVDELFYAVFNSEKGERLLNELFYHFVQQSKVADPSLDARWAFYRQGQNDVICEMINRYNVGHQKAQTK